MRQRGNAILNSGSTLFSSKYSNKSQTFATGAYQWLHEARPRRVVWLWETEYVYMGQYLHSVGESFIQLKMGGAIISYLLQAD